MEIAKLRTRKYEEMRPGEIMTAMSERSLVYLSLGPLEWHGPAMPYGTDPVAAYECAIRAAEVTGGVVLPPIYAGTERERDTDTLKAMGFNGDEYVVGQDFPKNCLPSLYMREEVFSLVVREYLRMLVASGFKYIVIVNGHGATNQKDVLARLACEFSNETDSKVTVIMAIGSSGEDDHLEGHATRYEHAVQMYLNGDNVDLSKLPPKDVKLKNCDWGITSASAYALCPNEDSTVEPECDPRNATAQQGETAMKNSVDILVEAVEEFISKNQ